MAISGRGERDYPPLKHPFRMPREIPLEVKMAVNLYTLRKRAVMVLNADGRRDAVYFLQLAVEHALAQDSQKMVDYARKHAIKEWKGCGDFPRLVVQVGVDGIPRPGSPIHRWQFHARPFCFDHELPNPSGYLGERGLWGYLLRTVEEQEQLRDFETAQHIDKGTAKVYKDYWKGEVFESGEEFLRYRDRYSRSQTEAERPGGGNQAFVPSRVSKILSLIRLIERKGESASVADLHFLGCLKDKASQLGHAA
jgi:hypothetical protein